VFEATQEQPELGHERRLENGLRSVCEKLNEDHLDEGD